MSRAPQGGFNVAAGIQWMEGDLRAALADRKGYHARDTILIERLTGEMPNLLAAPPWKHGALTLLQEFVQPGYQGDRNQRVWDWLQSLPAQPDMDWQWVRREGHFRRYKGFDLFLDRGTPRGWPVGVWYRGHSFRHGYVDSAGGLVPSRADRRIPQADVLEGLKARAEAMVTSHLCSLVETALPDAPNPETRR